MFSLKLKLIAAGVVLAAVAAAYVGGRVHGSYLAELATAADQLAAEKAYSDALAVLAGKVAEADAQAAEQRSKARTLASQVTRLRNEKLAALPPTNLTVPADRRVLIGTTYCARFPSHPACVSGELRTVPDSTTSAQ